MFFWLGKLTTALVNAVDSRHIDLENGSEVSAVFLDLSKAFNKVPHRRLLEKLRKLDLVPFLLKITSEMECIRLWLVAGSQNQCKLFRFPPELCMGANIYQDIDIKKGFLISLFADNFLLQKKFLDRKTFLHLTFFALPMPVLSLLPWPSRDPCTNQLPFSLSVCICSVFILFVLFLFGGFYPHFWGITLIFGYYPLFGYYPHFGILPSC